MRFDIFKKWLLLFLAIVLILLLMGCETKTEYVRVSIPVDRFVAVPTELSTPCDIEQIIIETWGDIAILAHAERFRADCNESKLIAIGILK